MILLDFFIVDVCTHCCECTCAHWLCSIAVYLLIYLTSLEIEPEALYHWATSWTLFSLFILRQLLPKLLRLSLTWNLPASATQVSGITGAPLGLTLLTHLYFHCHVLQIFNISWDNFVASIVVKGYVSFANLGLSSYLSLRDFLLSFIVPESMLCMISIAFYLLKCVLWAKMCRSWWVFHMS